MSRYLVPGVEHCDADDGTGVVQCCMFGHAHWPHLRSLQLGHCCLARGRVTVYRGAAQLKCDHVKIVTDPNFETLWINKVLFEKRQQQGIDNSS